jgi:hypothetical protein
MAAPQVTRRDTRPMLAAEFVGCCERLRLDYVALAQILRRGERTLRGYQDGRSQIPPELAALLRLAVRGEIKLVERGSP